MRVCEVGEAVGEPLEPRFIDVGKCQGKHCPGGARAHRGKVAEVHREDTMSHGAGGAAVREMDAVDQSIDGGYQVAAGRRIQQGRIIADTQAHVRPFRTAVTEVAINQGEF